MDQLKQTKYKKEKLMKRGGVAGKVKRFDKKLHSKYDIDARQMLKNVLGDAIIDNEDIYGEDMIFTANPFPYKYLEVQVLSTWSTSQFPYSFPFVYARKMLFSKDTLFVTFNKFLTEAIVFGRTSLDEKPSRLKKYDRECVHYVSWHKALRVNTSDLTISNIKLYSGDFSEEE